MTALTPQEDEADNETIVAALAKVAGRDDAHAKLIRALAGRVYVEFVDRMHWKERAEMLQREHEMLWRTISDAIAESSIRCNP